MSGTKAPSDQTIGGDACVGGKRPYESPSLTRLGAIADITQAGMTGAVVDVNPTNSAE